MIGTTTNTNGETSTFELKDLPENTGTSGYIQPEDSPSVDEITAAVTSIINEKSQLARPRNRAERRAFAKKIGKKDYDQFDTISETAKKLNYISLIQKLRKLNEEKGEIINGTN